MSLTKQYNNPKKIGSFSGRFSLGKALGKNASSVRKGLEDVSSYVLHREVKKPKVYNPFILYRKRNLLQADLIDLISRSKDNENYKYILIVCDTFTRKCWARPLVDKTTKRVLAEFKAIAKQTGTFSRLMTDAGTEFVSGKFKEFLKDKRIKFVRGNPHAPHVERLNRTIQTRLFRYMTAHETNKWVHVLKDVIATYNATYHRIIKMSPNEAELEKNQDKLIHNLTLYYERAINKKKSPKFAVGDIVSVQKLRGVFAKGYTQTFTDELFKVREVHTSLPIPMYSLWDYNGEEQIEGRFYENEMQRANYEIFKVEKVLRTRVVNGEKEFLVAWKGWPQKFNSWVKEKEFVTDLVRNRKKDGNE